MRFDPQSSQVPIDSPLSTGGTAQVPGKAAPAPPRSGLAAGLAVLVGASAIGAGAWVWLDSAATVRGAAAGQIEMATAGLVPVRRADESTVTRVAAVTPEVEHTVTELRAMNRSSKSIRAYEQGRTFMARGMPDHAIPEFAEALSLDPNHAGARYSLGLAYVRTGDLERARAQRVVLEGLDQNLANMLANLVR